MSIGGVEVTAANLSIAGQITVKNSSGSTMPAGSLVYISGYDATAGCYTVALADAVVDVAETAVAADLVLTGSIASGATGIAASEAVISGLNTSSLDVGTLVYLSGTAGGYTSVEPTEGISQVVGVVTLKAVSGAIRFFPGRKIFRPSPVQFEA